MVNGEPMLDADIWTETNEKKNFLRKGKWHHTNITYNSKTGWKPYHFRFENLELCLFTVKTMGTGIIVVVLK